MIQNILRNITLSAQQIHDEKFYKKSLLNAETNFFKSQPHNLILSYLSHYSAKMMIHITTLQVQYSTTYINRFKRFPNISHQSCDDLILLAVCQMQAEWQTSRDGTLVIFEVEDVGPEGAFVPFLLRQSCYLFYLP